MPGMIVPLPPPHFNRELQRSALGPCVSGDTLATDSPGVTLIRFTHVRTTLVLDISIGGFSPRSQPRVAGELRGVLFLQLDDEPEIDLPDFAIGGKPNIIAFRDVPPGEHRLTYGLRNLYGWDVAYGRLCLKP